MLGTDNSHGYCLQMICADFLAGANLENGNPRVLLQSVVRLFKFLPHEERQEFLDQFNKMTRCREFIHSKRPAVAPASETTCAASESAN